MMTRLTLDRAVSHRLSHALKRANRSITIGRNGQLSADESFAADNDLRIVVEKIMRRGRTAHVKRIETRWAEKLLCSTVRERVLSGRALIDPIYETQIDGRMLFIASFLDRLGQAAVNDVAGYVLERDHFFLDGCHGFRRKRGVHSALLQARDFMRDGFNIAHKQDIAKAFPSTSVDLVWQSLVGVEHLFAEDLLNYLGNSFVGGQITGYRGTRAQPEALFIGAPLSPLLFNIVFTTIVDRPIEKDFGKRVRVLRYADDFLVLTRKDPLLAEEVVEMIRTLLANASPELTLNGKGTPEAVDLLTSPPLEYLGLGLQGKRIVVPDAVYNRAKQRILRANREGNLLEVAAGLRGQLQYLRSWRLKRLVSELGREGIQKSALAILTSSANVDDGRGCEGPAHLTADHLVSVVAHSADRQLSLPGVR